MKIKYYLIIFLAAVLISLVLYIVSSYVNETESKLKSFCSQYQRYQNIYNFSEEKYRAYALSNLIRDELVYYNLEKSTEQFYDMSDFLEDKQGNCVAHAYLFLSCCNFLDLKCKIVTETSDDSFFNHYIVAVTIDKEVFYLDPSSSESRDITSLMSGDINIIDFWLMVGLQNTFRDYYNMSREEAIKEFKKIYFYYKERE